MQPGVNITLGWALASFFFGGAGESESDSDSDSGELSDAELLA